MGFLVEKENRKLYNGVHKELSLASWADQQGYTLTFTHVATGHSVEFPGTVTSFTDSHASELKMKMLYKETDPLVRTQNTMRKISFNFYVASASLEEARYNEQSLNLLMCMMYPRRNTNNTVAAPGTLIRVRGLKFINTAREQIFVGSGLKDTHLRINSDGIGIYIQSLEYSPDTEAGFITSKGTGGLHGEDEIYPARIELSIQGDVWIDQYTADDWQPLPHNYPSYR
jgi:predicted GIY-YIG superfamily endonuclease